MIQFTQGDTPTLNMTAQDGDGNPVDISGASFSTQILGPTGALVTIPNSQHTIVLGSAGTFQIALTALNTQACAVGPNKDVVTQITQGPGVTYFRGQGILTVQPSVPQS